MGIGRTPVKTHRLPQLFPVRQEHSLIMSQLSEEQHHLRRAFFVNAPLDRLHRDLLPLFLEHSLQPEIGLETGRLWDMDPADLVPLAASLDKAGLARTLHAPFHDLTPGGFEPRLVALTREKLKRAFALIPVLHPRSMVCHLGFDPFKHQADTQRWLEVSLETWQPLISMAREQGVPVMFENTYEPDPDIHTLFLSELATRRAGFCLDTGHLLSFAEEKDWRVWLDRLGPRLGQCHLHDNRGTEDQHLALGRGVFDFQGLFARIREENSRPLLTLEPHSEEDLWQSLDVLTRTRLFGLLEEA